MVEIHRVPRFLPLSPSTCLPGWGRSGGRVYRVLAEGRAAGIDFARGELLLTRGEVAPGQTGLLLPRGYGRPMIGSCREEGAYSEPGGVQVSPERWRWDGRLVARARSLRIRPRSGEVLRKAALPPVGAAALSGGWIVAREEGSEWRRAAKLPSEGDPWSAGAVAYHAAGAQDHRVSVGIADHLEAAALAARLGLAGSIVVVCPGCDAAFLDDPDLEVA